MNTEATSKPVPKYSSRLSDKLSDGLFVRIMERLTQERRYRDSTYTARQLAADIGTNVRYVSASVATHTGDNYNALVNGLRLRDARRMLRSRKLQHLTVEEIGLLAGFSSRQAFYIAYTRAFKGETPAQYREQMQNALNENYVAKERTR